MKFSWLQQFAQQQQTQIQIKPEDLFGGNSAAGAPREFGPTQIEALLGSVYLIAGIVAVIAIVIGAIRFMSANGEASKVASAKNVISYAVVGLVVVLVAASATNWIIGNIAK